jgi:hypothetical protein
MREHRQERENKIQQKMYRVLPFCVSVELRGRQRTTTRTDSLGAALSDDMETEFGCCEFVNEHMAPAPFIDPVHAMRTNEESEWNWNEKNELLFSVTMYK